MTTTSTVPEPAPLLVFQLSADTKDSAAPSFGLFLEDVIQVIEPGRISPVPLAPTEILGIMNYRGRIVTVVDLATVVGMPPQSSQVSNIVVLRPKNKTMGTIGLQITRAREVVCAHAAQSVDQSAHPCVKSVVQTERCPVQVISTQALLSHLTSSIVAPRGAEPRQGESL